MDVAESRQRDTPHGALSDLGEDAVTQLVEALRQNPSEPVSENYADRHGDHAGRRRVGPG